MAEGHVGDADEENRERYRELLEELRTILPGAQVLFAFLLMVPFSQRFTELDPFGRDLYGMVLVGTAMGLVVFLAPASFHRVAPRRTRQPRLRTAIALAIIGMFLLGASVVVAVFTVMRFIFGSGLALTAASVLASVAALTWYLIPLAYRLVGPRDEASGA